MSNLDLLVKAVVSDGDPERIILFGSYLNGSVEKETDLDIAVIQKKYPRLGQKAKVYLTLVDLNYDWSIEPDIHFFSKKDFEKGLKERDLFISEISKGRTIYAKKDLRSLV